MQKTDYKQFKHSFSKLKLESNQKLKQIWLIV